MKGSWKPKFLGFRFWGKMNKGQQVKDMGLSNMLGRKMENTKI